MQRENNAAHAHDRRVAHQTQTHGNKHLHLRHVVRRARDERCGGKFIELRVGKAFHLAEHIAAHLLCHAGRNARREEADEHRRQHAEQRDAEHLEALHHNVAHLLCVQIDAEFLIEQLCKRCAHLRADHRLRVFGRIDRFAERLFRHLL